MGNFRLRTFCSPNVLREVRVEYLRALFERHAEYFARRGVQVIPAPGAGFDYEGIAGILMTPDESAPTLLVDDLYFVDEMATVEGMDALRQAVTDLPAEQRARIDREGDPTPADLAVAVRLFAPELLERKHAESFVMSKRSFYYYRPNKTMKQPYAPPSEGEVRAWEQSLGDAFDEMKRGRSTKVFVFERESEVDILVRRGEPCKREASVSTTGSTSVYYRPEVFDVIRFDRQSRELSISAGSSRRIHDLHREKVGLHLFGRPDYFADKKAIFTLDPLRELGSESLACGEVEGMESVVLREIQLYWGGPEKQVEVRRASDLFRALERKNRVIPAKVRITKAKFQVRFADSKTPRTIAITNSNQTSFTRDSDAELVETWMVKRGFTLADGDAES